VLKAFKESPIEKETGGCLSEVKQFLLRPLQRTQKFYILNLTPYASMQIFIDGVNIDNYVTPGSVFLLLFLQTDKLKGKCP
jgi:hypothetical protein